MKNIKYYVINILKLFRIYNKYLKITKEKVNNNEKIKKFIENHLGKQNILKILFMK